MTETRLKISLIEPHPKQLEILRHPAKRKVVVCGRRVGKTVMAAYASVRAFLNGQRVLYAAPKLDQTDAYWKEVTASMAGAIDAGAVYKNETRRLISAPYGRSFIRAKTAHNANTLRSDNADILILDEFSLMDPDTWSKVGAPMMLDTDGEAWFIFTPKRKNHAHRMYLRGVTDESGRWASWNFSSHENPYLSSDALAEITSDMTEADYKQEILAEFLDSEGAVFRNIGACMNAPQSSPDEHAGHSIVAGVDWAKSGDYTAISVGCATCRQELALDRFNKIDYVFQRERLKSLFRHWGVGHSLGESNSIGEPNLEMLQIEGVPIGGFQTTATSKPPLISNLSLCLERAEWQFLPDPIGRAELEAYEQKVNNMGRSSYSAPEGMHDDTVIARALMVRAGASSGPLLYF